jgi:fructokinase
VSSDDSPVITVCGEALIDLVPEGPAGTYVAHAGGSPFNVAIALARLGGRTALLARLSDTPFGLQLREAAEQAGVDVSTAVRSTEPTTLAVLALDEKNQASYAFYLEGTADWQWTTDELQALNPDTSIFHFGSLASWTGPGCDRIHERVLQLRATSDRLISYDPNARPSLMPDLEQACEAVERNVAVSHLVKASRDDLAFLYPGSSPDQVAATWQALGATLVVITDGEHGATGYLGATTVCHPGYAVQVVDTVGAGDAFTAALLDALARRGMTSGQGLAALDPTVLEVVLGEAVVLSALSCERAGADPLSRAELRAALPS